jgi:hypothetical protein
VVPPPCHTSRVALLTSPKKSLGSPSPLQGSFVDRSGRLDHVGTGEMGVVVLGLQGRLGMRPFEHIDGAPQRLCGPSSPKGTKRRRR